MAMVGLFWTVRTTYSKGCRPLNFLQEYIKPVYSHDLYVISLFHGSLPLALGCSGQMRGANFVALQQHYARIAGISKCTTTPQLGWHRHRPQMQ